jgi:hypothetical protein
MYQLDCLAAAFQTSPEGEGLMVNHAWCSTNGRSILISVDHDNGWYDRYGGTNTREPGGDTGVATLADRNLGPMDQQSMIGFDKVLDTSESSTLEDMVIQKDWTYTQNYPNSIRICFTRSARFFLFAPADLFWLKPGAKGSSRGSTRRASRGTRSVRQSEPILGVTFYNLFQNIC